LRRNTYMGGTTITSGGTLFIANSSGSATGTGLVTVNSGGILEFGTLGVHHQRLDQRQHRPTTGMSLSPQRSLGSR